MADPVCVRRVVRGRGRPPDQDYRAVARRAGAGFALSRVQPRHRLELGDQSARRAYTRCDRKADLPHLQKPPCALAPAAFSRASHLSLAADAARLARPDEALDDGDDSLRRKLADDLLPGRFTVVYWFRNPVPIFEFHRHADYYQHCRYRP